MGVADIELFNDLNGLKTFDVSGYYSPEERNLNLITEVNRIPLDLLNLVLYSFASGVKGYASGKVLISGNPSSPVITGNVMAEDASMVIDYLQTRFMFSDTIRLEENGYFFDSIEIRDDRGNRAMLDGYVTHNAFDDFKVGIRIDANNMRVLDTRQKDNDLFYGTAYASGVINIISDDADLELDISARTEQNTRIFFPLKQNEQVSDYSFISFKDPLADSSGTKEITLPVILPKPESSIGLGLNLDVTQDAEIQLVFDASVGDVLRSTGSGNLNMTLDSEGNFSMFGDYTIEDGDYQLTLGNIFNKRFIVEEGGYIRWNGDITNAELDIKAIYRLRASLYELLLVPEYKERIPVECHLNMSGQLVDPVIEFDIFLPTADEKMRTDLRNAINSDEEMSRQFLYLLVMNSF
jgi:autotransporter translocation and assembly factor TamB